MHRHRQWRPERTRWCFGRGCGSSRSARIPGSSTTRRRRRSSRRCFNDHGGLAVRKAILKKTYPKLEYCVQYRESDMAFVCRLMEQHGISYHFRHSEGKHELIMGDDSSAWKKIERGTRPYYPIEGAALAQGGAFLRLDTGAPLHHRQGDAQGLLFRDARQQARGAEDRRRRLRARQARNLRLSGPPYQGRRGQLLRPGPASTWSGRPTSASWPPATAPAAIRARWSASKSIRAGRHEQGIRGAEMHAFPVAGGVPVRRQRRQSPKPIAAATSSSARTAPMRRRMVTEKPFVHGPQTAVVVGDSEIHCDEYGRIKVRFHWDRCPDQSMWCRLSPGLGRQRLGRHVHSRARAWK